VASAARAATVEVLEGRQLFAAPSYDFAILPSQVGGFVQPQVLNQAGAVAGADVTATGSASRAFVYSGGTLRLLPSLAGGFGTAFDLNEAGTAVGQEVVGTNTLAFLTTAGGSTVNLGSLGGTSSQALRVNEAGQVAGLSSTADGTVHAFLRTAGGQLLDISLGGAVDEFSPLLLNEAGLIAGTGADADGAVFGFVSNGTTTTAVTGDGVNGSSVVDLNATGAVAGNVQVADGTRAYVYRNGLLVQIGTFAADGSGFSQASDLSDSGVVVGTASDDNGNFVAFKFDGTTLTPLGLGGDFSQGLYVNEEGDVVGQATTADGLGLGFFQDGVTGATVGLSLGGTFSTVNALSESGQVVGSAETATGAQHAFLYTDGTTYDLNSLMPAGFGGTITDATKVNAKGQIVAFGTDATGNAATFLLSPKVQSPVRTVADLTGQIVAKVKSGVIGAREGELLLGSLRQAQSFLDKKKPAVALVHLGVFRIKLGVLNLLGRVPSGLATELDGYAVTVINNILSGVYA
jgi:probable HAF family extracellular repeat protein